MFGFAQPRPRPGCRHWVEDVLDALIDTDTSGLGVEGGDAAVVRERIGEG